MSPAGGMTVAHLAPLVKYHTNYYTGLKKCQSFSTDSDPHRCDGVVRKQYGALRLRRLRDHALGS